MPSIKLKNVSKTFEGGVKALNNISLDIARGEFLVLLGPSGCGKTTLLKIIAGLIDPTSGVVERDKLSMGIVFQTSALLPISAFDNIALGLRLGKKIPEKNEITARVNEAAKLLSISKLLRRNCMELSGGEKQRVALARALATKPDVLLLDEPLSKLDTPLKAALKKEIAGLYKKLNSTFIYVTHDQSEAMSLASRIVLLKDGVIQQADSPANFFSSPNNKFVASFIGSPPINFIKIDRREAGIRPQHIRVFNHETINDSHDYHLLGAYASHTENLGTEKLLYAKTKDCEITAIIPHELKIEQGQPLTLALIKKHLHFFS